MKNKNNFENEVTDFLNRKGGATKTELVEYLQANHPAENGYELGYSKKNLDTKLGKLVKRGVLITIQDQDELDRFGIKKQDGRASYYFSKTSTDIKSFLDSVIIKLESTNPIQQKVALKEIEYYEKYYVLNPKHLDMLVSKLDTDDVDLIDQIIRILYDYIEYKNIEPANESKTIEVLRSLLKKYPEPLIKHTTLREHLIYLLGYYNDYSVIERLKKDAETLDNLHKIAREYKLGSTANIIEEHREELYNFEERLWLENKNEAAQFIGGIRVAARDELGMIDHSKKEKAKRIFQEAEKRMEEGGSI